MKIYKNDIVAIVKILDEMGKTIVIALGLLVSAGAIFASIMILYGKVIIENFFDHQAQWFAAVGGVVGISVIIYAMNPSDRKNAFRLAIAMVEQVFPFQSSISKNILSEVDAIKRREGESESVKVSGISGEVRVSGTFERKSEEITKDALGADDLFEIFRNRMLKEIMRLQWAANKNLFFAVAFCGFGAWLLIVSANEAIHSINLNFGKSIGFSNILPILIATLVPRALVGIMISAVGYFFLKVYMSNEMDIKHTKNEITNIESRVIAYKIYESSLSMAKNSSEGILKNISAINSVIESFANTERNFVIENGRGTASRESASEILKSLDIVQSALDKFPTIGK